MQGEFTQNQFQKAAEAGAFVKVVVQANWANFKIFGEMRNGGKADLITTGRRVQQRLFLNPAAALALLRKMGINKVEVQMEKWDLELATLSMRVRPDVTARRVRARQIAEAAYGSKPPAPGELSRGEILNLTFEEKMERQRQRMS